MLFTPEPIRRKRAEIAREFHAGNITEAEAGARLAEADPDFGGAFVLLGNAASTSGNLVEAESCFWKALERIPCDYTAYLGLFEVLIKRNPDDPLARRIMLLAIWKLAFRDEIPDEVANFFRERVQQVDLDFKDPASFEVLAVALDRPADTLAEVRERLLPYELLNDLLRQAPDGLDASLVADVLTHAERSIPVWSAALHEWAEREDALPLDALGLVIALLGEMAGPEIVEELLELADSADPLVLLHANWAIWRVGQRFPAEALAYFRKAAVGAPLTLRCALAEHIHVLPEIAARDTALIELLDGFAGFTAEEDASFLLARVAETLRGLGRAAEADRISEQFQAMLPPARRQWVRQASEERIVSTLEGEIVGLTIQEICSDRILMDDEDAEVDDDESEDEDWYEPVPPVVAPARPGRNDPCWCGSGKKYKKCHLPADESAERSAPDHRAKEPVAEPLHTRLQRELMESLVERRHTAEYSQACRLYLGRPSDELDTETENNLLGGFSEWYIHDFRPASSGRTLLEEYLRKRAGRLTAAERDLLESWRQSRFAIWEVQRVERGRGVELRDLFADDQLFVHDISSSRSMVRWDCVMSRVHQSEGEWYFVGNGYSVPRNLLPGLRELIERESREAGATAAAFVRANSHRWPRTVDELAREQLAALRIVNAEGDPLEFCAAEYRVDDEAAVIAALEAAKPFQADGQDEPGLRSFGWLEQGTGGPRRSYGHIKVHNGKLRLECNSRKRLAIGRQLVEKHGGARLVHVADSFKSLDAIKQKAFAAKAGQAAAEPQGLPPELQHELIAKFKNEHYAHWADEPLPALGGRTPREAARSEAGRRDLEDLLRTMENGEERSRQRGDASFDFTAVRKTLGM